MILAHRGGRVDAPENTLEAFEKAAAMGVDGFETDVRLTADGQAVLFHDRHAPGGLRVASSDRRSLEHAAGHPVPTLAEALDRFPDLLWMIEVKAAEAADAVVETLRRRRSPRRLIVTSFDHPLALGLALRLRVEGGVILAHRPLPEPFPPFGLPPTPRALSHIVWRYEPRDAPLVSRMAHAGYQNWVYDLETPEDHESIRELPLAGIITDRPESARDET